jgi:peptidylprolyl isomerase
MSTPTSRPTPGDAAKRRFQAVAGGLAGLAIVIVLAAVYFGVRATTDDKPKASPVGAAASQPADQAAASEPAEAPDPSQSAPAQSAPAQSTPAQPGPSRPAPVDTPAALSKAPVVKAGTGTVSKLTVTPLVQGTGPVIKAGQTITANYVVIVYKTGQVVDSSWTRGQPFSTAIGSGQVIEGWDKGIPGQKVGSRLQLDVPAAMAYGPQQGDLRFVVDILAAK